MNTRTGSKRKKWLIVLLAVLIPAIILQVTYFVMQFYPVGDRTPLTIDLYHQYVSFLSEVRRKLLSGENPFYTWSVGLGTNFYSLIAYYAASPLNLFLVLFPQGQIPTAVMFLTVLKIGLTGGAFAYFLIEGPAKRLGQATISSRNQIRYNTAEDSATDIFIIVVSAAYALNAYNLAFSWDLMWLDVVALLPLVALGVNRIVREGRSGMYIVTLAASLFINYYIAFFTCLFTLFYFFVVYFTARADRKAVETEMAYERLGVPSDNRLSTEYAIHLGDKNDDQYVKETHDLSLINVKFWPSFARVAGATFVAVLVSAVMLLPTILSLFDTSAAGDSFPSSMQINFDTFDFLGRGLMTMSPSIRDGLPNVYAGILIFIFLPLYIFAKKISTVEKVTHLSLLGFIYISFNNNFLNFIWHGMHYPNQLPYRYSFIFSFVLLIIAFRTLTVIKEFSPNTLMLATLAAIGFVVLYEYNADITRENAFINILYFLIYLIVFAMFRKPNFFRTASLLLAVVMIGELSINTMVTIYTIGDDEVYTSHSNFVGDFEEVGILIDAAEADADGDFYRMEVMPQKTTNDGALYGYPGFTMFSSTSREDTARLFRKMGYHGNNINSYKFTASTPVNNSLMGIRYMLRKNGASRDPAVEHVAATGDMSLSENPFALSVGVPTGPELLNWNPQYISPFSNWNNLLNALGEEDLFQHVDVEVVTGFNFGPASGGGSLGRTFIPEDTNDSTIMNLRYEVPEDQYVYFAIDPNQSSTINITINEGDYVNELGPESDSTIRLAENRSIHWIETFDIGYTFAGDVIDITLEQTAENASSFTIYAVTMDKNQYEETMTRLQDRDLNVTEWTTNSITAEYQANTDGYIYLSIPYESGWNAYINGEEVQVQAIADGALLSVPTPAGSHTLELKFIPRGFYLGLGATILGLLLLSVILLWQKRVLDKREAEKLQAYLVSKADYMDANALYIDSRENLTANSSDLFELMSSNPEYARAQVAAYQEFINNSVNYSINEINTHYHEVKAGRVLDKHLKVLLADLQSNEEATIEDIGEDIVEDGEVEAKAVEKAEVEAEVAENGNVETEAAENRDAEAEANENTEVKESEEE